MLGKFEPDSEAYKNSKEAVISEQWPQFDCPESVDN